MAELKRTNKVLTERVTELEARLGQSPRNSSKSPSSEGYEKPAPKSRRTKTDGPSGGRPGHKGHTLKQVKAPDDVLVNEPAVCGACGRSLADAPVVSTKTRQVFDLPPIKLWIVEHQIQHLRCSCGQVAMAEAPAGVGAPTQYGPRVRALGVYLLNVQQVPLKRTTELMSEARTAAGHAASFALM